ncbi:MAG: 1,2-phenylacetyl-CoA epoxidase subunit PaaE [Pseudomonadota bacterium]|nr:1,2-phenylacetyl-CoA epoxidase subunit PaaE [Pseudomonadota bacterium]
MAAPRFHALTVADIRKETDDAVSIAFAVPEPLREDYRFAAGQYLTLKATIDGREIRRSYSICSAPADGELRVAIRRVDGGLFSSFANDDIRAGDAMDVMTPDGRFTFTPDADRAGRYVAFAAGSGITPVLSMIATALAAEPKSEVTLVYGNRSTRSALFREELEDLKNRFPTRLSLVHVLSREAQDVPLLTGRIDADKAAEIIDGLVDVAATDAFWLCGPQAMVDTVTAALKTRGVDPKAIRFELFTPADDGNTAPKKVAAPGESLPVRHIAVIVDGHRTDFDMVDDGTAILDAALTHHADLPYACKGGMCCTCRAKLVEGEVEMAKTYSLEDDEIAQGYVLTCQATPKSDRIVLDFDQRG